MANDRQTDPPIRPEPYDQRLGSHIAAGLQKTPISANAVTLVSLALALAGAIGIAAGPGYYAHIGAGLFVVARFLDHVDGELARRSGTASRLGYYLDYYTGAISFAALFLGMGIGFADRLGWASLLLGTAAAAVALGSLFLNMRLDCIEQRSDDDTVGYPQWAGFELEDGIYLLAPVTWLGWLMPFFVAATLGATVYGAWTAIRVSRSVRA